MGPYLSVFSSSFLALLSIHGQLISIVQTSFLSFIIIIIIIIIVVVVIIIIIIIIIIMPD